MSPNLATMLVQELFLSRGEASHAVVLDLGAGIGQYGRFFKQHWPTQITYVGLDGAENVDDATNGLVRFADLTDGLPRGTRTLTHGVDWAISLEVAEYAMPR